MGDEAWYGSAVLSVSASENGYLKACGLWLMGQMMRAVRGVIILRERGHVLSGRAKSAMCDHA